MSFIPQENVALAAYTTLQVGGVARYFSVLNDTDQLPVSANFATANKVPVVVLGGGANVLVADGLIDKLVLKNELKGITFQDPTNSQVNNQVLVTAAAGESWDDFVKLTLTKNLSGLENLSGIPGTVGAAPIQNINAYGVRVGDLIHEVEVFDWTTKYRRVLSADECQFGYRDSLFKHQAGEQLMVTAVTFALATASEATMNLTYQSSSQSVEKYLASQNITQPTLLDVRRAILHVRSNIGMCPGQFRSAGSFFKNTIVSQADFARILSIVQTKFPDLNQTLSPWYWSLPNGAVKISTAFLMECSPYNKHTYGTKRWRDVVGLSPLHSLSIVTEVGAIATDVKDFVAMITEAIADIFGITVETEVNYIS